MEKRPKGVQCCKDCTDRVPGCHDHCLTYKAEKDKWTTYQEKIRLERYRQNNLIGYSCEKHNDIVNGVRRHKRKSES